MEEWITYSYATSIKERIEAWQAINEPEEQQRVYNDWRLRKSLLTTKDYKQMFHCYHWNETLFSKGILPFTEERARLLLPIVRQSDWFVLHQKLFQQECPIDTYDLKAALRFHLAYYESYLANCLAEHNTIVFSDDCVPQAKAQLGDELFYIAQKSLVWDIHQMMEEHSLQSPSKEEEFIQYIHEFLGDAQRTFLLYGEYPALARVLSTRLTFACEAIKEFICALEEAANQLVDTFSVTLPIKLVEINMGRGDSHNNGKAVIRFYIEKQPFVFKPKNLLIGQRFNELLTFLETLEPSLRFYHVKRLVFPTFTIEENIDHRECTSVQELVMYYQRYGQLLAVIYWLGTTDLHMENLIANGAFPVLIDVETLIQPNLFSKATNVSRQNRMEKDSVLVSGLLPSKYTKKSGVTFDALAGKKQKINKKVSRLQNNRSSDIFFQWDDGYMSGAKNQPMLNGVTADYHQYRKVIEASFKKTNKLFLTNKARITEEVKSVFANTTVRLIYRDTQNYSDILGFSVHVDCMSNYIEREKVISNLWANQAVPKALIPFEVKALLAQDIPCFTANTSKKSVSIANNTVLHLLPKTPLAATVMRLERLNEATCDSSQELLRESLNLLDYRLQEIDLPAQNQSLKVPLASKAADIGDFIIRHLIIDREEQVIDWLYTSLTAEGKPVLVYPQKDLYAGSGGLYLFFMYLNHFVPKPEYQELLGYWERELFTYDEENMLEEEVSAFFGIGSCLLITFYGWQVTGKQTYRKKMDQLLAKLTTVSISDAQQSLDWLTGLASFVAVLAAVDRVCQHSTSRELLSAFTEKINCQEMPDNSFAHGYAGVLYALKQSNQLLNHQNIQMRIDWYSERFVEMAAKTKMESTNSWCRKTQLRDSESQTETTKSLYEQIKEHRKMDACICHGTYGQIDDELELVHLLINQPIYLKGDRDSPALGLFCGLAGVGYQLLRAYAPTQVKSILFIS